MYKLGWQDLICNHFLPESYWAAVGVQQPYRSLSLSLSLSLQMKRAPIVTDNPKLLEICITSVKEKLQDSSCSIVKPTDTFRKRSINSRPISAANLLMYDTSVVNGKPLAEYHFHKVPLTSVIGANELSDFIGMVDHFLQKLSQRRNRSYLRPAIVQCEAEVFKELGLLGRRGITTAVGQTSAITGPILNLLRSFCHLKVCIISVNNCFCCKLYTILFLLL